MIWFRKELKDSVIEGVYNEPTDPSRDLIEIVEIKDGARRVLYSHNPSIHNEEPTEQQILSKYYSKVKKAIKSVEIQRQADDLL